MIIVALHGFLGTGRDWEAVQAAGPSDARWITPDLFAPGAGEWVPPDGPPAWLVGYSFGARLALHWLTAEPDRWHGALLLSVNPGNFQTDAERAVRRADDQRWAEDFRRAPWAEVLRRWNAREVFGGAPAPARSEQAYDREKLARALTGFSVADQFTDPERLPGPLVWLAGSADERYVGLLGQMRAAGFPGTFDVVEGAGHRLGHEAPRAVAAALRRLTA
jgi:2-succinyl-6-hydroxy-2,4-cyclohexadiene-1-carboxylate synthase